MTPSDWSLEALKEHFEARFLASSRAVEDALAAVEKATVKAEEDLKARFLSVNEFRDTLKNQQATFVTRTEMDARITSVEQRVSRNEAAIIASAAAAAGKGSIVTPLMALGSSIVAGAAVAFLVAKMLVK